MRRVVTLAFATLLGVGLAAFYVMPALLELDLIQIQSMTEHGMDFHGHFVPPWLWFRFGFGYNWNFGASVRDAADLMPVHISAAHWVFIAAALIVTAVQARRHAVDWRVGGLIQWLGVTAFAMFMMTSGSTCVWEAIPALSYVQFPWRFFMLLSISGAALGALLMSFATSRRVQAVLLILIVGLQVHLYHRRLHPGQFVPMAELNIDDPNWRHTPEAAEHGYYEPAYDPIGVERRPSGPLGRWTIVDGHGTVEARALSDASVALESSSDVTMTLRLNSHAFPGWSAQVDGREVQIVPTARDHYMEIVVPAGRHQISVELTSTPVRAVANAISFGAAAVLVVLALRIGFRGMRTRRLTWLQASEARRLA
jgi:hypothetical protein